jgi:hypothetical protein
MGLYTVISTAEEESGTQSEQYDVDSGTMTAAVTLRVPAADRYTVVADILTHRYYWPHTPWLGATASKVGISADKNTKGTVTSQGIVYDEYLLTVQYTTRQAQTGQQTDTDGNVFSEELQPMTQHLTLDHKKFEWSDLEPLLPGEAPTRIVRSFNLVRTLYNVRPPLPLALLDAPGCVNDAPFTSPTLGLTFPAETLLFGDPGISRQYNSLSGFSGIVLKLSYAYMKNGWNKYWFAKIQNYAEIKLKKDGSVYKNYPPISFTGLLF